jgi:WD40 repeat protein
MRQLGAGSSPVVDQVRKFPNPMEEVVFSNDGKKLLVGSGRLGAVSTVSVESMSMKSTYFLQPTKRKYNLATSCCSSFGMASTVANNLDIWNIESRVKVRSLVGHDGPAIGLFSPKHALVATASMPIALWAPFVN